jgi:hypothetical protein
MRPIPHILLRTGAERVDFEVDLLNELGSDGWELVSITSRGVAYFKRVIAPANSRRQCLNLAGEG